eukprot:PITA_17706
MDVRYIISLIQPPGKKMDVRYIITATEYLTRWAEAQTVKDCSTTRAIKLLFEFALTWFIIRGVPYHPQANRTVEAFNKILESALTKICNAKRNDWDVCILAVLWAYKTTCKKLTGQTPFRLVYGIEVVMLMEYIVLSLQIATLTDMADRETMEESLAQLMELEEDRFVVGFHQHVQKEHEKAWPDRHIKLHTFQVNDLVLLYDRKFTKFPGKFQMH